MCKGFTYVLPIKKKALNIKALFLFMLAYLDSNQDKQNQNLSYYHYTIGQSPFIEEWTAKLRQVGFETKRKFCSCLRANFN